MRIEKELPLSYQFHFPAIIDTVFYDGKILVIAREEGCWIVLENQAQLLFFQNLGKMSLGKAIESTPCTQEDAQHVVTQLVARHFESPVKYQTLTPVMQLYLTNACNMSCPHCYMFAGHAEKNELDTDEIQQLLHSYAQNGGVDVKLTGGEIALRQDLPDIVKYGHGIGLNMELLTNGTLWGEQQVKDIAPFVKVVQISIDGYDEESNAKVRGKGNFAKALKTIELFAYAGVKVNVAMTAYYSSELPKHLDDYADFAKSIKKKYKDYNVNVAIATGLLPGRYGELSAKQAEEYTAITQNIYSRMMGCQSFVEHGFIERHKAGVVLDNCSYGYPSVASNGDVYMCPIVTATKPVANIREKPLQDIMDICHHAHQLSRTKRLTPCNRCELKAICCGDCRVSYFPDLRRNDITNVSTATRSNCSEEVKHKFYKLMIETNTKIFH